LSSTETGSAANPGLIDITVVREKHKQGKRGGEGGDSRRYAVNTPAEGVLRDEMGRENRKGALKMGSEAANKSETDCRRITESQRHLGGGGGGDCRKNGSSGGNRKRLVEDG